MSTTAARLYRGLPIRPADPRVQGPNHSVQLDALDNCLLLEDIGLSVFFVLGKLTAARPSAVVIEDIKNNAAALRARGGSGTPLGLFRKTAPWLRPLEQFAKEELGL